MTLKEKALSLLALLYFIGLTIGMIMFPMLRAITFLIPAALIGVLMNMTLLFIVFRDIFSRTFASKTNQYLWALAILLFQPAVLVYLPKYGFKPRETHGAMSTYPIP